MRRRKPRSRRVGRRLLAVLALAGLAVGARAVAPRESTPALAAAVSPVTAPARICATPPDVTRGVAPEVPRELRGRVGLYVVRLEAHENGYRPAKVVAMNENGIFPLASVFKQAVALELFRQVANGTVDLSERFDVGWEDQSLGRYPYDNSTALTLADLMIRNSDNTATDLLFRRLGLGSLQPLADELDLCHTRLRLPTKTWWTAQAGFGGPDFPQWELAAASRRFATADPDEQLALAEQLDARARSVGPETLRKALAPYWDGKNGGRAGMSEIDRNLQNASTPFEWATLMQHAFLDNGLPAAVDARFREVMATGYGQRYMTTRFRYFGGKHGNTAHVFALSGYLETLSGEPVIYVLTHDESRTFNTMELARPAFRLVNAAIAEVLER